MGVGNSFVSFLFPLFSFLFVHLSFLFILIPSRAHARIHYIVLANCLHSFTDGGEGLKIKGIGVKAKVKEKSEDIEVKSKVVKANQAVARCFSVGCEGSEGKKRGIIV